MRPLIYVAGKLSALPADYIQNMRIMIGYAHRVRHMDLAVHVPCLDLMMGLCHKMSIRDFMADNLDIMLRCDAVALVPGWENSSGTKMEIEIAEKYNMPILKDWDAIVEFAQASEFATDVDIEAALNHTAEGYKV